MRQEEMSILNNKSLRQIDLAQADGCSPSTTVSALHPA
jgi:hypothetical protein